MNDEAGQPMIAVNDDEVLFVIPSGFDVMGFRKGHVVVANRDGVQVFAPLGCAPQDAR